MSDCGCSNASAETDAQRKVLWIALLLNAIMFIGETGAGVVSHSTGLIADGIDMLADAAAYAIALTAVTRGPRFKANAATASGSVLIVLGLGILAEVARRFMFGSRPEGHWMISVGAVALLVNAFVLWQLGKQRRDEVHIRATWIFTRADVIANAAVVASGLAVLVTANRVFDLIVGCGIGIFILREASEILLDAQRSRAGH